MLTRNGSAVYWDDGSTSCFCSPVYTDWTAIALLLFTAVPLLVVVGTAVLFVLRNQEKAPLG